jgi:hypothetical protein
MAGTCAESAFLFLENGSRDGTRALLQQWCAQRPDALLLAPDQPVSPVRTVRLAALRNQLVETLQQRFVGFDLFVLADCDDVNIRPADPAAFGRAVDFLLETQDRAAVFGNTIGGYPDLWALRHPIRCPDDVWEATMDYALGHKVSDEAAYDAVFAPRLFSLPPDAAPMEVTSAFGGLGIYRMDAVLANPARYAGFKLKTVATKEGPREVGWQTCEHVAFHQGLVAQGGRLFVLPGLVHDRIDELTFPKSGWRSMVFDPAALSAAVSSRNAPCPCGSGKRYKHCCG